MKKIYLITFIALAFAACKKNDQLPGDSGCITQIKRQNFDIKNTDSVTAIQLLKQNNIPYNDVQLEYFSSYNIPTGESNPGTYQSVFVIQQINGLPILSSEIWYQFTNSILQTTSGIRYNEINLSNSSSLQLTQLRAAYLAEVTKNNSTIATQLKDSCLVAQFGYYDLNVDVNSTPNFVKAWLVKPQHSVYPQVTLQDGSGKTIVYNGGIIAF
jgi:hypothetical protein